MTKCVRTITEPVFLQKAYIECRQCLRARFCSKLLKLEKIYPVLIEEKKNLYNIQLILYGLM